MKTAEEIAGEWLSAEFEAIGRAQREHEKRMEIMKHNKPGDWGWFQDYEPEQAYGTAEDFREHLRYGGTREDY